MTMSAPSSPAFMSVKTSAPSRSACGGSSVEGATTRTRAPMRVQHVDVGAGDARVQDVAADRHGQPGDAALGAADGERVEQRLRRMLVRAVAGVDHRAVDLLRQQLDRAGRVMAHDQDVGPHGVQRHGRVDQRLALRHGRGRHVHVHDVGAEPLARQLEGALRAGRGLEEQVDQRAPAQDVALLVDLAIAVGGLVGQIEQGS